MVVAAGAPCAEAHQAVGAGEHGPRAERPERRAGPAAAACGAPVESGGRRGVTVCRADAVVHVDGHLDDPGWRGAAQVALPFETFPGDNVAARIATRCMVAYDQTHLYVGCEADDPDPRGVRAFFAPRDELSGQDRIGIVIDTFNDARRAFQFVITPLGVQADGVFDQQRGSVDDSWDAIWRSAGRVTATGFAVEAAIPFKSLRFPRTGEMQTWGFYLWRIRPRSEDGETRSVPLDRGNGCLLCQAGLLAGLGDIAPSRNVQLTPTLTSSRSDTRPAGPPGPLTTGTVAVASGVDAQWSPSPNVAVAATVNPDFSQVEADVAQLDVNNRFTLFFPEKRPFFLEGAEFYGTPIQAVFTRTISNPVFGARMTGKLGRTALGGIVAGDRVNNLLFPANQGSSQASLVADVTTTIARVRQDVGASGTLGLLYTGREGQSYHNRVLGVDALVQPLRPLTLRFQLLRSHSGYPDTIAQQQLQPAGGFTGTAVLAQADYDSRTWRGEVLGRIVDPGFRADAGFVEQADVREVNAYGQRQFWGRQGGWMARLNFTAGFWTKWRSDDLLTERVLWGNILYLGPGQLRVYLDHQRRREFFQGATYALNRYRAEVGIAPSGAVRLRIEGRTGDAIDLANARKAVQSRLAGSAQLRLGRHLDLNLSHAYERLASDGVPVVTAQLPQARAVYNISARAFIRVVAQYRLTRRTPGAFAVPVDPTRRHLFTQLLFAYEANPQTLLFVGCSDDQDGLTDPDGAVVPLTPAARTFFMKMSYAWRP